MKAGNIFSHLCFVYHHVARNVDMLEKNQQNRLILSLSIITILLIFISNHMMTKKAGKINNFHPHQRSQNNQSYINLENISRRTEKNQRTFHNNNYNCGQEWTSFIVPYRNRKEHLPLFLKAVTNHEKLNSKQNVRAGLL